MHIFLNLTQWSYSFFIELNYYPKKIDYQTLISKKTNCITPPRGLTIRGLNIGLDYKINPILLLEK